MLSSEAVSVPSRSVLGSRLWLLTLPWLDVVPVMVLRVSGSLGLVGGPLVLPLVVVALLPPLLLVLDRWVAAIVARGATLGHGKQVWISDEEIIQVVVGSQGPSWSRHGCQLYQSPHYHKNIKGATMKGSLRWQPLLSGSFGSGRRADPHVLSSHRALPFRLGSG